MKKKLKIFLCLVMVLLILPVTAFADPGDGNVDGGGGGLGDGTSTNVWIPGHDGVRVTVIRDNNNSQVSTPIDYTNIIPPSNMTTFAKVSKIGYRDGAALTPQVNQYTYLNPDIPIPYIVNSSTYPANIDEIKSYFCSEYAAQMIADDIGMSYEDLISGEYKLLIEPIAYV